MVRCTRGVDLANCRDNRCLTLTLDGRTSNTWTKPSPEAIHAFNDFLIRHALETSVASQLRDETNDDSRRESKKNVLAIYTNILDRRQTNVAALHEAKEILARLEGLDLTPTPMQLQQMFVHALRSGHEDFLERRFEQMSPKDIRAAAGSHTLSAAIEYCSNTNILRSLLDAGVSPIEGVHFQKALLRADTHAFFDLLCKKAPSKYLVFSRIVETVVSNSKVRGNPHHVLRVAGSLIENGVDLRDRISFSRIFFSRRGGDKATVLFSFEALVFVLGHQHFDRLDFVASLFKGVEPIWPITSAVVWREMTKTRPDLLHNKIVDRAIVFNKWPPYVFALMLGFAPPFHILPGEFENFLCFVSRQNLNSSVFSILTSENVLIDKILRVHRSFPT